jgi:hypothetical protein
VCVLTAAAVFCYLQLFILPVVPRFSLGDQLIYLVNARRMLEGEVIYRDFFQFTPPGTEFVYVVLFALWGVRAWIPGGALVGVGVGLVWLCTVISRKLMSGAAAFIPGLLFLTLPFRTLLDGTHHWYSTLAITASLAALIENRSPRRLVLAGALAGVSAWFNQSRGLAGILGVGVFLFWERKWHNQRWRLLFRNEVRLFAGFLVTVMALSSYFVWKVGLKRFLYSTVAFGIRYYPSELGNGWSVYGTTPLLFPGWYKTAVFPTWLFIHLLIPLVYILFFVRAWREAANHPQEPWDRLMLVNMVGLFLFLGVAPAATFRHLCTVSVPALILLVWFAGYPGKVRRFAMRLLGITVVGLVLIETRSIQTRSWNFASLPIGTIATFNPGIDRDYHWFLSRSAPSDFLFGDTFFNFAFGFRNPAKVNFLTATDYTRPEQVRDLIEALEQHHVRWVIWNSDLDLPHEPGDHLAGMRSYLHAQYHLARTSDSSGDQVWERNKQQ